MNARPALPALLALALAAAGTPGGAQVPIGAATLSGPAAPAPAPAPAPAASSPVPPSATPPAPAASTPDANRIQFGTGFVIDQGYILTAWHVIQDRGQWQVGPNAAGRWVNATLVKVDRANDLALLKAPLEAPALALAPSNEVPIGLEISVIGFPQPRYQGMTRKITQGYVNGVQRASQQELDTGLLQISAEVSMGNSGGPVFAPDGAVVGMVQRKLDVQRIAQQTNDWMVNVSYAQRSSTLIRFLQDSPARATVRPLQLATVLRPYQLFEKVGPSVVSVSARGAAPTTGPGAGPGTGPGAGPGAGPVAGAPAQGAGAAPSAPTN